MLDLTSLGEWIDTARADGTPVAVATSGPSGQPDISVKGSMMVWDKDHLVFWERTHGTTIANLRANPQVAAMYFSQARGMIMRFFGEATQLLEAGSDSDL